VGKSKDVSRTRCCDRCCKWPKKRTQEMCQYKD